MNNLFQMAYDRSEEFEFNLKNFRSYLECDPLDDGKMTYCGISRVFYPAWKGWALVDTYLTQANQLIGDASVLCAQDPNLASLVLGFYHDTVWKANMLDLLNFGELAVQLYDSIINPGTTATSKAIQGLVNATVDGHIGPRTIVLINAFPDQSALTDRFLVWRKADYDDSARRWSAKHDGKPCPYLDGWKARCVRTDRG